MSKLGMTNWNNYRQLLGRNGKRSAVRLKDPTPFGVLLAALKQRKLRCGKPNARRGVTAHNTYHVVRLKELRTELYEWQRGCQRSELYAEYLKQRLSSLLLATEDIAKTACVVKRESSGTGDARL